MADALRHRGPDDAGTWVDAAGGIALGHRRLAIIDLSANGHQPMVSPSGRFVLAYNGELYNFRAMRGELNTLGAHFRGHSDTEVLLTALDHWGLGATLPRLNGMFAFSLWDKVTHHLHLVRDRLGEKPLYFGWSGRTLLFGSELKALRAHPAFTAQVDRDALALYLRHNCVPAPYSIYGGVWKLPPATMVTIGDADRPGCTPRFRSYWSLRDVAETSLRSRQPAALPDLVDELEELLSDAVGLRMESDVPLGAFLSGGVDSSTIVALMQRQSSRPVRTFTVGFDDPAFDESPAAGAVARHLGTEHVELRVTPKETLNVVPRLPALYDEPFADSSQVPTVLISELTRQHVTVSLSGDGGDELFGGYNRYVWCPSIWNRVRGVPSPIRRGSAVALRSVSQRTWDSLFALARPALPDRWNVRVPGMKVHKLAEVLPSRDMLGMYRTLSSHWKDPARVVLGGTEPPSTLTDTGSWPRIEDPVSQMMYLDTVTYLPDDILVKVDRASMSVGLEARVPFLDHRVVEFAWTLPSQVKLQDGSGKWPLRQVLARHVPPALTERPKMGFGLPLGDWLRGPLRGWAEDLLSSDRLASDGFFDPSPIRKLWTQHLSGRGEWPFHLWDILMFQAWLVVNR
jgi:asparagine synthase (glutamine-hydrolysing)